MEAPRGSAEQLPQPAAQQSSTELESNPLVKNAVSFLQSDVAKRATTHKKILFLKEKGLSNEQIKYALDKTGHQISLASVQSVRAIKTAPAQEQYYQPAPQPVQSPIDPNAMNRSYSLFPPAALPREVVQPEPKSYDWRDVVIGVGATLLAGFGAAKLFTKYSPYEFRRKSDKRVPQQGYRGSSHHRRLRQFSSDSEMDRAPSRVASVPPVPATPVVPGAPAALAESDEVARLQAELAEAKEALASERKRGADLAVTAAKMRGEKQQLSRTNEKLSQQVDELKEAVSNLETQLHPPPAVEAEKPADDNAEDNGEGGVQPASPPVESPTDNAEDGSSYVHTIPPKAPASPSDPANETASPNAPPPVSAEVPEPAPAPDAVPAAPQAPEGAATEEQPPTDAVAQSAPTVPPAEQPSAADPPAAHDENTNPALSAPKAKEETSAPEH